MLETISQISASSIVSLDHLTVNLNFPNSSYPVDQLIETAASWANELLGEEEIISAREDFFQKMGKVFHDDDFYEVRMSYFLEHFLFERPIAGFGKAQSVSGLIPYQLFISRAIQSRNINPVSQALIASLAQARHSLYQIERIRPNTMSIRDLLIPQKILITAKANETFRAFSPGIIFQSFVFRLPETCHLGAGIIIHPLASKKILLKKIHKMKKNGHDSEGSMLNNLASLQLKYLRHKHVDPRSIYAEKYQRKN